MIEGLLSGSSPFDQICETGTGGRLSEEIVECSGVPDKRPELADLAAIESEELDSVLIEDFIPPYMMVVDEHGHEVIARRHLADIDREVGRPKNPGLAEEPDDLFQTLLVACEPSSAGDVPVDVLRDVRLQLD